MNVKNTLITKNESLKANLFSAINILNKCCIIQFKNTCLRKLQSLFTMSLSNNMPISYLCICLNLEMAPRPRPL